MKSPLKRLEIWGRAVLIRVVARCFAASKRPVDLPDNPRILVVRFDERIGNVVLLTPLLSTLRAALPDATIDVLARPRCHELLAPHPAVDNYIVFRKRALLAADGPLRTPAVLRRHGYDLAIDASNPTDPSVTHALLVRLCGARHTLGSGAGAFGALFTAPVEVSATHEIDLRLELLAPLKPAELIRQVDVPVPIIDPASATGQLLRRSDALGVIHTGAGRPDKHLTPELYATLGRQLRHNGLTPVFTHGPGEAELAAAAANACGSGTIAPPTSLSELAAIMAAARAVISCDTGPMHLAVAVGAPTCGIFVSTPPERYGYNQPPHCVIDARHGLTPEHIETVGRWLSRAHSQSQRRVASGGK